MKSIKIIQLTMLATILVMPAKYLSAKGTNAETTNSSVEKPVTTNHTQPPIDAQYKKADSFATTSKDGSIKFSTRSGLAAHYEINGIIPSQPRYVEGLKQEGIVLTPEAKTPDALTLNTPATGENNEIPFVETPATGENKTIVAVKNIWVSRLTSLFIDKKQPIAESISNSVKHMVDNVENTSGVHASQQEKAQIVNNATRIATSWITVPTVTDIKNLVQSVSDAFTNLNPLKTANRYTKYAADGSYITSISSEGHSASISFNPDGSRFTPKNTGSGRPTNLQAISNRVHNLNPFRDTNIYRSNVVSGQTGKTTGARQRVITDKAGKVIISTQTTQPDGSYTITDLGGIKTAPAQETVSNAKGNNITSTTVQNSTNPWGATPEATTTKVPTAPKSLTPTATKPSSQAQGTPQETSPGETAAAKVIQDTWNTGASNPVPSASTPSWVLE